MGVASWGEARKGNEVPGVITADAEGGVDGFVNVGTWGDRTTTGRGRPGAVLREMGMIALGAGSGPVFTRIVGRIHKPLFAGLVDPSNDTSGVSVDDVSCRPDQVLSLVVVGFVHAGAGVGGSNVVDWREGLFPCFRAWKGQLGWAS